MTGPTASCSLSADRHVGRRLRERRLQHGLSLAELARALGVSTQQARKYEAGVNGIPATRLPGLAALLGLPIAWFFEGLEPGADSYRPVLPTRPRMLLDLVRATDELPEARLVALCEAARALAAMRPGQGGAPAVAPGGVVREVARVGVRGVGQGVELGAG